MRTQSIFIIVLAAVTTSQCGSSGGGGTTQTPTAPSPATPSAVTVSIVGTLGNASYVPNPVAAPNGTQVIFRNGDTVTHHIVMDNGTADFGNLSPGASSPARAAGSGSFHCSIHPSMVGSFNAATAPEPPPGSGDGY